MLIPVILSGGSGSRLWPVSREAHPKPFMLMPDGESLLHKTFARTARLPQVKNILTITNRDYFFQTRDHYKRHDQNNQIDLDYILEPVGRNTAPAIAIAAMFVAEKYGHDAIMLVLPADHVIKDQVRFNGAVAQASTLAQQDYLVTFGINPDTPETGYGYINVGDAIGNDGYKVKRFVEKPDIQTAQEYIESGDFVWNAGMFCFKASVLLDELARHSPEIHSTVEQCWDTCDKQSPIEIEKEKFQCVPSDSIDYALMEKSKNVAVVRCDFDWSDVGAWDAVSSLVSPDNQGNCVVGEALIQESSNCYVHSDNRLLAVLGLENIMIIDTPDAVLVANKSHAQNVRNIYKYLKDTNHPAHQYHNTVYRPWGSFTILEEGNRFKMKRLVITPGSSISLQKHRHRSEHWVVVAGTAEVVNGDDTFTVHTNESTYIPSGNKHRLANEGNIDLIIIEVQSGEYLGEDDIVRYEDIYGRN